MWLDINHLNSKIDTTVCHLIYYTSKAFYLQYNPSIINHTTTHTVAFLISGFGDNLLKHCNLDKSSFKTKFAEVFHDNSIMNLYSVNTLQPSTNNTNNTTVRNPYARSLTQPTASQQEEAAHIRVNINPATKFIDYLRQTLETVLVTSIDNYNTQVTTNKASFQLEAFMTELLHEQATSDTSNQMDFSPSVSPQELQELVSKSTSKVVSSLTHEIQSLKSQLKNSKSMNSTGQPNTSNKSSKNSPQRGRQSASLKKTSRNRNTSQSRSPNPQARKNQSKTSKNQRNGQGERANDSSNATKRGQNKPKRSKSKGRRTNSRPNSSQN